VERARQSLPLPMIAPERYRVEIQTYPAILSGRRIMTGLQLLAFADDLTGAMEVGAQFAARGIASAVTAEHSLEPAGLTETTRVLVIDTATRHLPAAEAAQTVHRLASAAKERAIRFIFKKTDSTLRGNVGSEIGALMAAFPDMPLVYAPAYPRMGRTVRNGLLHVDGVPVSETAFGTDRLNPVRDSAIPSLLQEAIPGLRVIVTEPRAVGRAAAPAAYVVDGETEEDIGTAAKGFAGAGALRLAAGTAGIAGQLADHLPLERTQPAPWPSVESCLVVNGSLHQASLRQIDYAHSSGWPLTSPQRAVDDLAFSRWVLARASDFSALAGEMLADRVGRIVADIVRQAGPDALFVLGGDTAGGVHKALGSPMLRPLGEVLPGVPMAVVDAEAPGVRIEQQGRALLLITKAGGFGSPEILEQVRVRICRT
jgi:uncharacterized protein YgbK (DUF1537 family)